MSDQHKNDTYGNIDARNEDDAGVQPPIPAATVILLRDAADGDGCEILMLKKNSKITFGGMWVFPGGKIDPEDYAGGDDLEIAARNAAAREAEEEASIQLRPDEFAYLAHWTPPPGPQKRFATWFFVCAAERLNDIVIDHGEIKDHAWIKPSVALARHRKGEIDLAPPTWVTLYHLSLYSPASHALAHFAKAEAKVYSTHVAKRADGVRVAMWAGDSGYEPWDADAPGERHRLVMAPDGFQFENTVEDY
ncbi:MAG: NUDIX domain-containing protein [Pseudomonadota bacterium]